MSALAHISRFFIPKEMKRNSIMKETKRNRAVPTLITLNFLLNRIYCGNQVVNAKKIWDEMEKVESFPDTISYNAKLETIVGREHTVFFLFYLFKRKGYLTLI